MKKLITLLFNIYFAVWSVFGQENALYREVHQVKETNTYFENVVLTRANVDAEKLKDFINPDDVSFFENSSFNSRNIETQAINLSIPFKTKDIVLELVEVPEYFYDYKVITSNLERFAANKDIKHFRGVVKDEERSLVAITFYEDEIMGIVATDEGNFNIVKNKQSGKHLFYNDKNLKEKPDWVCDTEYDPSVTYDPEDLLDWRNDLSNSKEALRSTAINKLVRFYIETEYNIYQATGSVSSVEAYILSLLNQVAVLYQNEDILTAVSCLYIWTSDTSYPYAGKNTTADLLDQFGKTRTSIIGDLGMLLTARKMGGRAYLNGLCSPFTQDKLGVSGLIYGDSILSPVYSRSVKIVTHEFGHLLGSKHTHACVWNGNDTAIDGCGINAGYPEGNCANPGDPSGKGTIMSYCDQPGRPGVNFNLGFGYQPGNLIRNKVNNANCLQACSLTTINNKVYNSGIHPIIGCRVEISNTTILPNTSVGIYGTQSVILKPGFHAMAGSNVRIVALGQPQVIIKSSTGDEDEYSHFSLEELAVESPEIDGVDFSIYPNPNDGNFTVKITGELQPYTLEIFNNLGGLLGVVNCNDEIVNINRTDLNAGIYFVKITMNEKMAVKKIIVQ